MLFLLGAELWFSIIFLLFSISYFVCFSYQFDNKTSKYILKSKQIIHLGKIHVKMTK